MKLRFLGQTYTRSQVHIETISSDYIACFRGQNYYLRVPVMNHQVINKKARNKISSSASIRKYRGVSYIVERKNPLLPEPQEFAVRE